ncbi:hypothetical protein EMIT091MI3_280016 [Kosakonia quasisacchari]
MTLHNVSSFLLLLKEYEKQRNATMKVPVQRLSFPVRIRFNNLIQAEKFILLYLQGAQCPDLPQALREK